LVGIYAGIETRFLFIPGTGNLVALEVFPDDSHDPCVLQFSDFANVAGQTVAKRWQVFHAGDLFADFQIDQITGGENLFPSVLLKRPPATRQQVIASEPTRQAIRDAQRKVVKIYGAGGLREMEAYQSGILVSPQGHVLTMLSYVLDTDDLVAILDDGRKLQLEFLRSDPVRDIAVLKLPDGIDSLPYFDLQNLTGAETEPGQRILALSNLYGIATGDEAVSVLQGVVTAFAPLAARRGAFHANFRGQVYILDAYANNPGAAGGALVDWRGRLLGMLGKELRSEVTGTWLNYALPAEALAGPVDDIIAGRLPTGTDPPQLAPEQPLSAELLGLRLVPNVLPRTPPYIDTIRRGSAADRVGLRPDDLIVFLGQQPIASRQEFFERLTYHEREEQLSLAVLRDGALLEFQLVVDPPQDQPSDSESEDLEPKTNEP